MEIAATSLLHDSCVTDLNAPEFEAAWQRRAFGLAVALSEFDHYPWESFQQQLIQAIGAWEGGSPYEQRDWQYYDHWLTALERVAVEHGLVSPEELP